MNSPTRTWTFSSTAVPRNLLAAAIAAIVLAPAAAAGAPLDDSEGWMSNGKSVYITVGAGLRSLSDDPAVIRNESRYPGEGMNRSERNLAAEIGVFFVKAISLGLRYEHHSDTYKGARNFLFFGELPYTRMTARGDDVLLDLRAWIPPRHGFLLGVAGGYGSGRLQDMDVSGAWSRKKPVYQFYAGTQVAFTKGNSGLLLLRVGYALRDFGTIDKGTSGDPDDILDLDMSAWFVDLNIGGIAAFTD